VKSFEHWDIYYLYEYAYSFMLHGDGDVKLIYFEHLGERFCYVVMQKDIADSEKFAGIIEKKKYYDWETPYGYGGPLGDKIISTESQRIFAYEIKQYCIENGVVSQFVRFHPLLNNQNMLSNVIESRYLRDTIYMDVDMDEKQIFANLDSKNRNMVRKAQKNDVIIEQREIEEIDDFIDMYNETMIKNQAAKYYIFEKEYFDSLNEMKDNVCLFYAMRRNVPISGAIIYYNSEFAHYHLSGSKTEFRKYSPSNLLLYQVACWAHKKGIKKFHLGGGMAPDDSLFGFKKQFNRNGRSPFAVGRTVFDDAAYQKLLVCRERMDPGFDVNNNFMIQYRR